MEFSPAASELTNTMPGTVIAALTLAVASGLVLFAVSYVLTSAMVAKAVAAQSGEDLSANKEKVTSHVQPQEQSLSRLP
jgi:CHASE3 domain sensor protein